jgi:hypothetical protein
MTTEAVNLCSKPARTEVVGALKTRPYRSRRGATLANRLTDEAVNLWSKPAPTGVRRI